VFTGNNQYETHWGHGSRSRLPRARCWRS
jgi:hypothetical protein